MPTAIQQQKKFTQGEIDPEMLGRSDIEQWYGAASYIENMFPSSRGGLSLSPGLEYIATVLGTVTKATTPIISAPNGGTAANANDDNTATEVITTTNIGVINPYVIVQYDLGSSTRLAYVRVQGLKCSTGTVADVFVQTSVDNVTWVNTSNSITVTTTAQQFTVRVQANARYVRLARIGSTNLPTTTMSLGEFEVWYDGALGNVKYVNFEFSTAETYLLVITEFNIAVYYNDVYQVDIHAPQIFNSKIPGLNRTSSANTMLFFEETLQPLRLTRTSSTSWTLESINFDFIPKYDYIPASSQPAATLTPDAISGVSKLTASAAVFPSASAVVNQYIQGNGGRGRIVKWISTTVVQVNMEIPFFSLDVMASGSWDLQTGYVSAWGGGYGWPRSGTFYEGRLWIGGSQSLPRTYWGSRVGDFYNFEPGTGLANDAITGDLQGANNELNAITNIYGGKQLFIFTTGAVHLFDRATGQPITPENQYAPSQVNIGAEDFLDIKGSEEVIYFIQRGGRSLRSLNERELRVYESGLVSKLSGHLMKKPTSVAMRPAVNLDQGAYYLMVNPDGTMTIANLSFMEKVASFFRRTTAGGLFKSTGVVYDQMYVAVDRVIGGNTRRHIEKFNSNNIFDCSRRITTGLPAQTFFGLGHLEGQKLKVHADGKNLPDVTVVNGSVTISTPATQFVEFGYQIIPVLKDTPVVAETSAGGTRIGKKKRVAEINLRVYETTSLKVNKHICNFQELTNSATTAAITPYTGIIKVSGNLGWTDDCINIYTQETPGKLNILEIARKVSF